MGRALARYVLLLFLVWPGAVLAQAASLEVITPHSAHANFLELFGRYRLHLERGEKAAAKQALTAALESKWDGNLGDLTAEAGVLVRQAEKVMKNGDPELAAFLAEMAEKLAPGSVELQLYLARYDLGGGLISPGLCAAHYLRALILLPNDFPMLYRALARLYLLPLAFMAVAGGAFILILGGRYFNLLAHDVNDFFPAARLPAWLSIPATATLLLLPLAAGLSLWWLCSWLLIVFYLYLKGLERALCYFWFVALGLSPLLLQRYAILAANRAEPALPAALRARGGVPEREDIPTLEQALSRNPEDLLARMALADLLEREGRFNAAVETYTPAFKDPRTAQAAYNNVAGIYYAVGDLKSALNALLAARKNGPSRVEIPHNLGQYYQHIGQMSLMGDQYKLAQAQDEKKAEELRLRSSAPRLNRAMAPIEIPWSLPWDASRRGSAFARQIETGVWRQWMGNPRGLPFQAAAAAGIVTLILLQILGRNWRASYRCACCGQPICVRCQKPAPDVGICLPCYNVFKGDGGVDLKVKMRKRAEVQRYRDRWSRLGLGLALLLPGSGQFLLGFSASGLILLILSSLTLAAGLGGHLLWPAPDPVYRGGLDGFTLLLSLVYLVLAIVSGMVMRSKLDSWR
jgi:tetratricopeptide (TPR) repeat protein